MSSETSAELRRCPRELIAVLTFMYCEHVVQISNGHDAVDFVVAVKRSSASVRSSTLDPVPNAEVRNFVAALGLRP